MELEELEIRWLFTSMYLNKNKKNHPLSDTFCVGRSAFLFFYYCAYQRPEKTSEYDQEIPQSHTTDQDQAWYYNAFYKTTESILFRTQIVCAKMCVWLSAFCPQ